MLVSQWVCLLSGGRDGGGEQARAGDQSVRDDGAFGQGHAERHDGEIGMQSETSSSEGRIIPPVLFVQQFGMVRCLTAVSFFAEWFPQETADFYSTCCDALVLSVV